MILADCDIENFQRLGMINIYPWTPEQLQPASYDLRVGVEYTELGSNSMWTISAGQKIRIHPDDFYLLHTEEIVTLGPNVAAQVAGKSTWARRGLIVESAGFVDPGFSGQLTLEVKNIGTLPVDVGTDDFLCQIVFHQMRSKALNPYGTHRGSHYQGQTGPTHARS